MNHFKMVLSALLLSFAAITLNAQSIRTKSITFDLSSFNRTQKNENIKSSDSDIFMFPDLSVNVIFDDDNNNGILEALEQGKITLEVSNSGGKADTIIVMVTPKKETKGLLINNGYFSTSLNKNEKKLFEIPILATIDIPTDSVFLDISVKENVGGFDALATLQLSTFKFQGAELRVTGVRIVDAGRGLRPVKADGMVQKGETVMAYISIQNVGQGIASSVKYRIETMDNNAFILLDNGATKSINGEIKDLLLGENVEIPVRLTTNNRYEHASEYLPFTISVEESFHTGDIVSETIPIPLNQTIKKPQLITVAPDLDKLSSMKKSQLYSQSDRFSSNIKYKDVSTAPLGRELYPNAIAVVIGAGTNSNNIAPVPYAANDAAIMEQYFRNTMGIHNILAITDKEVTRSKLLDIFNPNGDLSRFVVKDCTDVFVYYSGHGIPDKDKNGNYDVYLVPDDCRNDMLAERGYSLSRMYANLNNIKAKSVTVILDACFSGSSRASATFASSSISNNKGIMVEIEDVSERPWEIDPNFRVLSSSSNDQTSLAYDRSQSGLFTYYLALGMQGEADSDKNGIITLSELNDYVTNQVSTAAKQIRNGDQTPQLHGNGDMVVVQY